MSHPVLDINTEQRIASSAWVVVASLYQARLLRFHSLSTKRCRFEERCQIEAPIPAEAIDRFSNGSGTTAQPYQARYQQLQKEYQRFAQQLACWVQGLAVDHAIDQLTLFAPARLMNWLKQLPAEMNPTQLDLRTGNLMNAYDDALRRHPDILGLLQPNGSVEQEQTRAITRPTPSRESDQQSTDKPVRKFDRPWRVFSPIPAAAYHQ